MAPSLIRTSAQLVAACIFLAFVLTGPCEPSRPILQLHDPANATISVRHDAKAITATGIITSTESQPASRRECRTSDINIDQYEISGVGLPTFQVRIGNSCTNPACTISSVIMHCGLFHTGTVLVNPKVFRRLDQSRGTCIVNDGQPIRNADAVIFHYKEIWVQPITFVSARVDCRG